MLVDMILEKAVEIGKINSHFHNLPVRSQLVIAYKKLFNVSTAKAIKDIEYYDIVL